MRDWRILGHDIIWTDGGCDPKTGVAAAGCAIEKNCEDSEKITYEEIAIKVEGNTAQAAEAVALKKALEWLKSRPVQRQAHILTDSYSSILALACVNIRNETMQKCFELLKGLDCVTVMHVPSHMGLTGNEIADKICTAGITNAKKFAKNAKTPASTAKTSSSSSPPNTIPFASFWAKVTLECAPKKDDLFLREYACDDETIANLSRIHTGAGKFNAYLNDVNKSDLRECPNCKAPEDTIAHFLYECPKFRVQRDHSRIMLEDSWSNRADFVKASGRKI